MKRRHEFRDGRELRREELRFQVSVGRTRLPCDLQLPARPQLNLIITGSVWPHDDHQPRAPRLRTEFTVSLSPDTGKELL
jgi:hypothetical protein